MAESDVEQRAARLLASYNQHGQTPGLLEELVVLVQEIAPSLGDLQRMADFIQASVPGEPSKSESAPDCLMRVTKEQLEKQMDGILQIVASPGIPSITSAQLAAHADRTQAWARDILTMMTERGLLAADAQTPQQFRLSTRVDL